MPEQLKKDVCAANLALVKQGLVVLTWGNVSGIDRSRGIMVIKPSGVPYDTMTPDQMVVVDLEGKVAAGHLNPSSDTPTHLALYKAFPDIGGITHTHSRYATMFAQACREIPCVGTTHADNFYGPIPVTRSLVRQEVEHAYEANTGLAIIERMKALKPIEMPGMLAANHGPFAWGKDAAASVISAVLLEEVARMALGTLQLNPHIPPLPSYLINKHYQRKHGKHPYYGQK
jgi:L-ribulose-5-phosphate 4-epimerase